MRCVSPAGVSAAQCLSQFPHGNCSIDVSASAVEMHHTCEHVLAGIGRWPAHVSVEERSETAFATVSSRREAVAEIKHMWRRWVHRIEPQPVV